MTAPKPALRLWHWIELPLLYALMLWPARHLISDLFVQEWLYAQMMHDSGVIAVQVLALSLAVTPVTLLLGRVPPLRGLGRWLLRRRRDFGLVSFIYAALHALHYIRERGDLDTILAELTLFDIALGWAAFVIFLSLAVTSNKTSKRWLGRRWKMLHRMTYLGAALSLWHWLLFDFFTDEALNWLAVLLGLKTAHAGLRLYRARRVVVMT